ncbi:protein FAR1-RELATED SEQUENCE 5-like [Salvia miltiorrhiza]|uniref:protein FAR1-RELATED SEQUENCE 5-like n=1 Tax=Salvia miltiorrhiza TaxID=226208 RepID=UPI0025AB8B50|nr:protein FAR1-RELATED SEQUENCE 5-like [Salvia miltiorrhiza]
MIFSTLHEAVEFYKDYAKLCGFDTRMSTNRKNKDDIITRQYVVCKREGVWKKAKEPRVRFSDKGTKKRKTTSCKVDCKAKVIIKIVLGNCYKFAEFWEGHTHSMVPLPTRDLMQSNRNVDEFQQRFIISGIKANIGPMRSFRMFREIMGSYDRVGCTSNDFKNFARDLKVHSKGSDAHMLLETFTNKQELGNGFKFFHDVDEENKLCRIIWADQTSIKNFSLFGEAVSFDATYNTNRYKLIFTPFTGKDNHGKCVSFGAALISHEDTESYSWVLERFVQIMGHAPKIIITDQDPALKNAVASCWKETRHRFCMWHINIKVAEKVPPRLREDTNFKSTYASIVWTDHDDVSVFEEKWKNMIEEFDLSSIKWFNDIFDDRSFWIPAYFREIPMSGLFRTTSASESENSYFKRFINKTSDLVLLYTNYCSGLDVQRYNYKLATHDDETRSPGMVTNLPIETNASVVYTNAVFKQVQDEIDHASKACGIHKIYSEGNNTIYEVDDNVDGVFLVRNMKDEDEVSCTCLMFTRRGLPCKHMFCVFRNLNIDSIPQKYIAVRWCKFSILCPNESYEVQPPNSGQNISNWDFRIFKAVSESISHVSGNEELYEQLYNDIIEVRDKFSKIGATITPACSKTRLFNEFYGAAPTESPSVLPPDIAKTKGSGAGGRRKSEKEKALILANKPKRLCRKCKTIGHHDSRNCPTKDINS